MNDKNRTMANNRYVRILACCILLLISFASFAEIKTDTKDVTCHGKKDGEVTISVSGASGNFEYSITGKPFQSSGTFSGLEGGSYTATVRDKDTKCEFTKNFEIKEPAELTISASGGGTFQFCDNQNPPTVTLTATASGGTDPVTVSPQSLTVSSSGTFTFTATDKSGCTATANVQVTMVPIVCSRDPNDIIGPEGVGPEKWVAKSASQPYTIRFENDPEFATAPAQEVRINQKVDKHVNLYSLRLGDFGFGSFIFSVPANKTHYSARLNVLDSLGVFVDVTAGIDVTKGEAFWIFKSIDPASGLPPADASLGFLLVNDSLHRGEGFVSYIIKAANNTVTADSIHAMANIVFDINEAIVTPEIFNTIDATQPASQVNPVPAEIQGNYTFTVAASDEGSGAESFDLYLSENNGDFKLLASHIAIDSGYVFRGAEGSHYAMYSVARDRVGNIESLTTLGDITFTVPQHASVKLLTPLGGEEYCAGDTITVTWESTHIDNIDLYYSSDNGANYTPIAAGIAAADSTYNWILPLSATAGELYKILIRASGDSSIHHVMDGIFTVNKAPVPLIISSRGQTICYGDSTVLSVSPSAFRTYQWSNGATTPTITATQQGEYNVVVTDYHGCSASGVTGLSVYPAVDRPIISASGPTAFCAGDSVALSAPEGFDGYQWSTGDTTKTVQVYNSSNYSVVVSTAAKCRSAASEIVSVVVHAIPDTPFIEADGPLSFCAGDSVDLFAPAGFARYIWSTGDTTRSVTVSQAGSYTVTVATEAGCSSLPSLTADVTVLPVPAKPVIQASGPLTFCQGSSVVLSVSGVYDRYLWSTGDTTQTITVSSSGNYSVTVNKSPACTIPPSDEVTITVLPSLPKPVIEVHGPLTFCTGQSVVLSAPAGYAGYRWSTGDTTRSVTVTTAGSYSVTVTVGGDCISLPSDVVSVTVDAAAPKPVVQASGPLSFCEGGSVTLAASEGYNGYLWSTGDTTRTIVVSSSGNYYVRGSMSETCVSPPSDTVVVNVISVPSKPVIQANGPLVFCPGGTIVLSTQAEYDAYLWSTGDTSPSIEVTASADIFVTVTNSAGCKNTSDVISIIAADTIPPSLVLPENIIVSAGHTLCYATVTVPIPGISDDCQVASLTNSYNGTSDASGHYPAGTTVITWIATDVAGNITVDSMTVTVNDPQMPVITAPANITQSVDADSCSAYVSIALPTVSDNCSIASVVNDHTHSSDASGVYAIGTTTVVWTVTDISGNTATGRTTVTVRDNLVPTFVNCPSDTIVTVGGDNCSDAVVSWAPPTALDACGIVSLTSSHYPGDTFPVGTTRVFYTAKDNYGNTATCSFKVTVKRSPLKISLTAKVYACGFNVSCYGAVDGTVTVNVSGGCAPYTYVWSDGQTGPVGTFGAGTYSVSVTDGNGVIKTASIRLKTPQPLSSTTRVSNVTCHGSANGTAEVIAKGGCGPYGYLWSDGQTTAKAVGLRNGTYLVNVTDANGCSIQDTVSLTQPAAPLIVNAGGNKKVYNGYTPAACTTLSASVSGGTSVYRYLWSTGETTRQINVCPGADTQYTVTVTDRNGCVVTDAVKVCVENVSCQLENSNGVKVCVNSSFSPWLKATLCVPETAVSYYLSLGATLGECNSDAACPDDDPNARRAEEQAVDQDENLVLEAYPNPVSRSAFITMYLSGVKSASLKVYSLNGIEVAELFNGELEGIALREFEFIPKPEMPNGMYFYRLKTNDGRVIMKKMMLMKSGN